MFSLEEMVLKFDQHQDVDDPPLALYDYIQLARDGQEIVLRPNLAFVSAVEHFDRFENKMTFLMADFVITCRGKSHHLERGLACYPVDKEAEERQAKIERANARLDLLYRDLELAGGKADKSFF